MKIIVNKIFAVIIAAAMVTSSFVFVSCLKDSRVSGNIAKTEFSVTIENKEGGKIETDREKVGFGGNFTITAIPDGDYVLNYVLINGNKVKMSATTMTIPNVTTDFKISGSFLKPNMTVSFDTGGGKEILPMAAVFGKKIPDLPVAEKKGFRFLGWKDDEGKKITSDTVIEKLENFSVTAEWEAISEKERENLRPFAATTSFYDSGVTAYGVCWHNYTKPVYPVLQVKSGDGFIDADKGVFEQWINQLGEEWFVYASLKTEFNKEYVVRFGDKAADVWSEEYTFTTREENADSAKFIYVTDTQESSPMNESTGYKPLKGDTYSHIVLKEAFNRFPESRFMVNGGDIVNYGAEAAYWREMMDSYKEFLFKYPLMVTAGNHEDPNWYSARLDSVNKLFNVDYPSGGGTSRGVYYSFDYGPMHFVCLRSNDAYDGSGKIGESQLEWFRQDMENAKARGNTKWNVALMHEGPLTPSYTKDNNNAHQSNTSKQWLPLMDELGIDLLLYGHDHFIDSTVPICHDPANETQIAGAYGVGIASHTIEKTDVNGEPVDKFVFMGSRRGTVMHQTGTAGHQFTYNYMLSEEEQNLDSLKVNGERLFRRLLSGGAGCVNEKSLSMYSYVEVTGDHILVKTYGVDVPAAKDQPFADGNTFYLDGFMLTR